jgi:hypothetical protein
MDGDTVSGQTGGWRKTNGRFAAGNPGGPGRPRRAIEREYLARLSDAVPLDAWQAIVERAVEDAKAGDARARDWLARYLVGEPAGGLMDLAIREHDGQTPEAQVADAAAARQRAAEREQRMDALFSDFGEREQ